MSETSSQFNLVRKGYDPAQVDQQIAALAQALQQVTFQRDEYAAALTNVGDYAAPSASVDVAQASYEHLGARIGQILTLARDEAAELKRAGEEDLNTKRQEFAGQIETIRSEADRYSSDTRRDADLESKQLIAEAHRQADEIIAAADADAANRRREAEAAFEEQRATSAKAAADFEVTLAERRKQAENEAAAGIAEANRQLDEANRLVDEARSEADRIRTEAQQEGRRTTDNAELQAQSLISDARAQAARVKSDSDRELAAATQRRDSINAQLGNVRSMLATLTGQSATSLSGFDLPSTPSPSSFTAPVAAPVVAAAVPAVEETVAEAAPAEALADEVTDEVEITEATEPADEDFASALLAAQEEDEDDDFVIN